MRKIVTEGEERNNPSGCCSQTAVTREKPCCPPASANDEIAAIPRFKLVPRVSTDLRLSDRFGAWKVRWGIGRMNYKVKSGLYKVGNPTADSPVLVSANYKMSFDHLRSNLKGLDAWILVLDTKGVNVWCSAGKGIFSTQTLIDSIETNELRSLVKHQTLILPQLSATGVSAHRVKAISGFKVLFGPVRAEDLSNFLKSGHKTTPEMRRVQFKLVQRIALIPMELVISLKYYAILSLIFFPLSGFHNGTYHIGMLPELGWKSLIAFMLGWLGGGAVTPMLLPYLPGRAFAFKGAIVGGILTAILMAIKPLNIWLFLNVWNAWSWVLLNSASASFLAMNFTGSSTFTSLSGVKKEMRIAVPLQIGVFSLGFVLWMVSRFI